MSSVRIYIHLLLLALAYSGITQVSCRTLLVKHHALAFVVAGVDFMGYIPVPHPWRGGQIIKIGVFVALQIDIKLDDAGGGGIQCPAALTGG